MGSRRARLQPCRKVPQIQGFQPLKFNLAAVWEPAAVFGGSRAAPAGAVQAPQVLLRLKALLGDLTIDAGVLRGPTEQPIEEEKNRDSKYDQAPPEHIALLSCLKPKLLKVPASSVFSGNVNWWRAIFPNLPTFKPANLPTFFRDVLPWAIWV